MNVGLAVQTLTDKEYQRLRDASVAIIREMGVECGGSNVQMAVNPVDGEVHFPAILTSLSFQRCQMRLPACLESLCTANTSPAAFTC